MAKLAIVLALAAVLVGSACVDASRKSPAKKPPSMPKGLMTPPGAIVAWAKLAAAYDTETYGKGWVQLCIPMPNTTSPMFWVSLEGYMHNVTMSHIHEHDDANGNPVRLDLLPRLAAGLPKQLIMYNPPVEYSGMFGGMSAFDGTDLARWNPDAPSWDNFLEKLRMGKLYANVHTMAHPTGEIMGDFKCVDPCMWPAMG